MQPAYSIYSADAESNFTAALRKFEELKTKLQSPDVVQMSHSAVEKLVESEGREILRQMYQAHITIRGTAQVVEPVVGSDDIVRNHQRQGTERQLISVFGPVQVTRTQFSSPGVASLHPVDGDLNLPANAYSHELRRRTVKQAASVPFNQAVETIEEFAGLRLGKRQAEELTRLAAVDFDAFYQNTEQSIPTSQTGDILVMTFDGKGVVVLRKHLKKAVRKRSDEETEQRQLKRPQQQTKRKERRNRKRMALVAAVYTVKPFIRTPEYVIQSLKPVQDIKLQRPKAEHKRVWASLEKPVKEVMKEAFAEARGRDKKGKKHWVVLVDGDPRQLKRVRQVAREQGVDVTIIMDFIHVLEYLWKASYVFNPEGSKDAEQWVEERLLKVLQGKASDVAAGIRRSATLRGIAPDKRKPADTCARYLKKNACYLRYDQYLSAGLPIATGVIEGACRHLIGDRLELTGARWSIAGAEAILRLRSLVSSGDFDEYWQFHEDKEKERNHLVHYAGKVLPQLRQQGPGKHLRLVK